MQLSTTQQAERRARQTDRGRDKKPETAEGMEGDQRDDACHQGVLHVLIRLLFALFVLFIF